MKTRPALLCIAIAVATFALGAARSLGATSVTSIARQSPGPVATGSSVLYQVTFNQAVTGVTTGAFSLTTTGSASGTIASVSTADGIVHTVTVAALSGSGTLRLDLGDGSAISGLPAAFSGGQSYVLSPSTAAAGFGYDGSGNLGNKIYTLHETLAVAVDTSAADGSALTGKTVVSVAAGNGHSLALAADGTVYAWGYNAYGQLGNNSVISSNVPVAVDMSAADGSALAGKTVIAIALGQSYSLALASDGKVYAWGYNGEGELGNGTTSTSSVPVAVDMTGALAGKTVIAIAAGQSHSLALASDGTVYAWGYNNGAQLGDGSTANSLVPIAVDTLAGDGSALVNKTVVAIAAGESHSLVLASDGTLYAWGYNGHGQLGNGSAVANFFFPVAVNMSGALTGKTVAAIAAGGNHCLALASDGTVFAWGFNSAGELGNNSTANSSVPLAVDMSAADGSALAGKTVVAIAGGGVHSLALASDGTLYAWGYGGDGQLGNGSLANSSIPVAVSASGPLANAFVCLAATAPESFDNIVLTSPPVAVTSIARQNPGPVADGGSTIFRVTFNQTVTGVSTAAFTLATTGSAAGTIASVNPVSSNVYDVTVSSLSGFGTVRLNMSSGSAISGAPAAFTAGQAYVVAPSTAAVNFGYNADGELGANSSASYSAFAVAVDTSGADGSALAGKTVVSAAVGGAHGLSLASDGTVYSWGYNGSSGRLGNNSTTNALLPVAVDVSAAEGSALAGKTVIAIAGGYTHSLALANDGTVYAWGQNTYGQFGNGTGADSAIPVAVDMTGALAGKAVIAIAAGERHSLALTSDGKVYAWGYNGFGELGRSGADSAVPVAVDTSGVLAGKAIVAIAAGNIHSLALASDGTVYAWGYNGSGQLGNGTRTDSAVPVVVNMGTGSPLYGKTIVSVAGGDNHSLAAASDGTVFAWGRNYYGELGNASTVDSSTPVAVSMTGAMARKSIVAVGGGQYHSRALASDGTAFAWGDNAWGELGIGSTTGSTVPVAVNTTSGSSALYNAPVVLLAEGGTSSNGLMLSAPTAVTVTSVSPVSGSTSGGTSVTITGTNFTGATAVKFGSVNASGFLVGSATAITATTASGAAGRVDVTVTSPSGVSGATSSDGFTFGAVPVITSALTAGATYGSAISAYTLTASDSPTSYGATGLPPGLSFNSTTCQITGTPTAVTGSPFSVSLSATNGMGTGTATLVFTIAKATATVSLGSLNAVYDGTAKSASASTTPGGLTVNLTYNGSGTAPRAVGSYTVAATVSDTNYQGTGAGTLTISKATPVITWATPAQISYGTALPASALNATASVPGSFSYSAAAGAVLPLGGNTLSVIFTPADTTDYNFVTASVTQTVVPMGTTVTLGNLNQTYDGTAKSVTVTTVPAGLSYILTYVGSSGAPVNAGTYPVAATVTDQNFHGSASGTLVVSPASQTITFSPIGTPAGSSVTLSATASSGLPVVFSVLSGNASLGGSRLTFNDANPVTVQASQPGNSNYNAAPPVTQTASYSVAKQTQSIAFTQPADQLTNAGPVALVANATSGLPVTFTLLSGPATLGGNLVTLTGAAGTVTIQASQAGNATYQAAASVNISFNVYVPIGFAYFGQVSVAAPHSHADLRPDASSTNIAAYLSPDRSSGTLIGYLSAQAEGFAISFVTNAQGQFTASTTALKGGTTAGPTLTFSGQVSGATISGTIAELGLQFAAAADPASGPSAAIASLYQGSSLASSTGTTYSIVGSQGEVFALAVTPGLVAAGTGTVDSSNCFSVSTAQSATISGSINPATTTVTGSVTLSTGCVYNYSGLCSTTPQTQRVINLSSRGYVGSAGQNYLVSGFVICGQSAKQVLIRAVGPTLSSFGISGVLANPVMQLFDSKGNLLLTNSGWGGSPGLASTFAQVYAFPLPANSADAAAVTTLQPGSYTVQVSGAGGTTGVALVEVYDVSASSQPWAQRLINVASRGDVTNGAGVLVTGFVVTGNSPIKVLIRGVGPTLQSAFSFPGSLSDPILALYDASGAVIAQNNDWGTPVAVSTGQTPASASDITTAAAAVYGFPLVPGSKDASLITTLAPGAYTAQVSGAAGATGVALIEVYQMQ